MRAGLPLDRPPTRTNQHQCCWLLVLVAQHLGGLVAHGAGVLLALGARCSTSRRVVFLVRCCCLLVLVAQHLGGLVALGWVAHGGDHRRGALWVGARGSRGGGSGPAVASGALSMGQSFGSCTGGRSERAGWTIRPARSDIS